MARDFDADDLFFASVADRNLTEARERHDQAVRQKRVADDDLITKKAGESQSKAAQARADFETAQSREQTAASQAQRLGSMSNIELATADNALATLNQRGWRELCQEEKATVGVASPDRAREEQEKAGARIVPYFRKKMPGSEFRNDLPDAIKATDEARAGLMDQEDTRQARRHGRPGQGHRGGVRQAERRHPEPHQPGDHQGQERGVPAGQRHPVTV